LLLEIANGNEEPTTKFFPITKTVKIGRHRDNDINLENFAYSRIHTSFSFNFSECSWYVQDGLDKPSTNGTW
jgi:hypothetical protein